jgi:16S rRNA A1518/A1519 N6-dimethyltransferase RsmA/KsgA/DIM1 with predicted DNA glycosylase/AP lyase activity
VRASIRPEGVTAPVTSGRSNQERRKRASSSKGSLRSRTVRAAETARALEPAYADPNVSGPVIELGPGTGPVTEALIRRGFDQDRLVLVEFNPDFCTVRSAAPAAW